MINNLCKKLPLKRLMIYVIALSFLPIVFVALYYSQKTQEWDGVSDQINRIHQLSETKKRKQFFNTIARNAFSDSDPLFLENHLEALTFLKKERESLEQLLQSPTFTGNEAAEKRYALLTSVSNRLEFLQSPSQNIEGVQETFCWLSHPVEIDAHDLKEVLNRLEGTRKGKPQLLITDFKCQKKTLLSGNEVFELNLKLLKREFHS
jgi:hypothetical protein